MPVEFTIVIVVLLGLVFGSFANVVIYRLPRRESVVSPPSACPACGARITPVDNVPVVSWLRLRGHCRHCGTAIPFRYPAVEIAVAVLWAAIAAVHGSTSYLPALLALGWALIVAALIDLEHRIIPNRLTATLPALLLLLLMISSSFGGTWHALLRGSLVAAALPGGMFVLNEIFRVVRGKQGLGMGDVKFAISLGLVLGYLGGWYVAIGLYATIISAAVVAFGLIATGRAKLASRIPFGPYLAVGTLVAILAGEPISAAVSSWLGLS